MAIGWSMDKIMKAQLVNDALLIAVWKRKPSKGLIWHSSVNAVSESFFQILKTELVHHQKFRTRDEAKQVIFE